MKTDDLPEPAGRPACAVCGRDTETGGSFMRLHLAEGRIELCTPECVRVYRAAPVAKAAPAPGRTPPVDGWTAWAVRWGP